MDLRARVDGAIERAVASRVVGTAVMVARGGQIAYAGAGGFADREARTPATLDTIFRLASVTKPIVCATAMSLIEAGKLSLTDPAAKYLSDFTPPNPDGSPAAVTIHQLLTHTAGLLYGALQLPGSLYERNGVSDGLDEKPLTMAEEIALLGKTPLIVPPGSMWTYGVATDVLGAVLEAIEGKRLGEIVEERIAGPLRMTDTAFVAKDTARLAKPYFNADIPRPMADPQVVPFVPMTAGLRFSPSRIFEDRPFHSGGAGMAGTVGDVMRFLIAIRNGGDGVLKQASTEDMMANQIGDLRITLDPTGSSGFGYGASVVMDPARAGVPMGKGTWRWGGVYGHHWYVDREHDLIVVCLTNTALEGMMGGYVVDLMRAVYGL